MGEPMSAKRDQEPHRHSGEAAMSKEERRFMAWLEKAMVHECSFAVHPLNKRVEYCQFCGVLREARGASDSPLPLRVREMPV